MEEGLPERIQITSDSTLRQTEMSPLLTFVEFIGSTCNLVDTPVESMVQMFMMKYASTSEIDAEFYDEPTYQQALRSSKGGTLYVVLVEKSPEKM